ncbi:MAG: AAA family ATPase [Lachnospiraceae bacterium]|nr:AAA family ATPase [Lachnospiraceae bacterium]
MNRNGIFFPDYSVSGILRELRKYLFIMIMLGMSVCLFASAMGKLTYQPIYESRAAIAVSERGAQQYSSLDTNSSMAAVYSEVFESPALQEKILEAAGEAVNGSISCEVISETNMLNLAAFSTDPGQAYALLQTALKNYQDVSDTVFSNAVLHIVQEPSISMEPSNSSFFIQYRFLFAAISVVCIAMLAVLRYFMRFTIKSCKGAEKYLDGEILSLVNEEHHKRLSAADKAKNRKDPYDPPLLLTDSLVRQRFSEQMRMLAYGVEKHMKKKEQKRILITSLAEHEGKTTVSLNLAAALAEQGKKVILIDGDISRAGISTAIHMPVSEDRSVTGVLSGNMDWKDALQIHKKTGVQLLLHCNTAKGSDQHMDAVRIDQITKEMSESAEYVIIDSSPVSVSQDAEVWMQAADTTLLVVRQDWSDVRGVNDAVDQIWQNCSDFAGFALNVFYGNEQVRIQKGVHQHV